MNATKQKKLEAGGWSVGSAADFLGLDEAEEAIVEMKLSMASRVKTLRRKKGLTQRELAEHIRSSQSRMAKLETADRSASLELYVRALVSLGETPVQIGKVIGVQLKRVPAKGRRGAVGSASKKKAKPARLQKV